MVAFQVEYIFDKVCANDLSLAKRRLSSKSGLVSETLYDCQHHGPCDPNRMDDYKDGAPAFARELQGRHAKYVH